MCFTGNIGKTAEYDDDNNIMFACMCVCAYLCGE